MRPCAQLLLTSKDGCGATKKQSLTSSSGVPLECQLGPCLQSKAYQATLATHRVSDHLAAACRSRPIPKGAYGEDVDTKGACLPQHASSEHWPTP